MLQGLKPQCQNFSLFHKIQVYLSLLPEDYLTPFSNKSYVSGQRVSEKPSWEGLRSALLALCYKSHLSEGNTAWLWKEVVKPWHALHPARKAVTSSTREVTA